MAIFSKIHIQSSGSQILLRLLISYFTTKANGDNADRYDYPYRGYYPLGIEEVRDRLF